VLDERPEERARGVTVDVAMARFQTPRYNVTLLDAPGHRRDRGGGWASPAARLGRGLYFEALCRAHCSTGPRPSSPCPSVPVNPAPTFAARDFVPNMISGAAQADAALLVVDGSIGGFEAGFGDPASASGGYGGGFGGAPPTTGQTREHAQLIRSLGVDQMAVVITKLDTCGYAQARGGGGGGGWGGPPRDAPRPRASPRGRPPSPLATPLNPLAPIPPQPPHPPHPPGAL
jgi:elongation factor 1 alpha-like protein